MAVSILEVRQQIVLVLYDYLLSSDEDAYWFSVSAIREGLDLSVSGALAQIAIQALVADKYVEKGNDDNYAPVYALTPKGIETTEKLLEKKGASLEFYVPAPSADLILSRIEQPERVNEISAAVAEVQKRFRESNSAAELNPTDHSIIASELETGAQMASLAIYRLRSLKAVIIPALRFLAEKFAGTGIEEAAKHLMKLLLGS